MGINKIWMDDPDGGGSAVDPREDDLGASAGPVFGPPGAINNDDAVAVDRIPPTFKLWSVGGKLFMVFQQPTPSGEFVPLAYAVTPSQLRKHFGAGTNTSPFRTFTDEAFASMGGLAVGDFLDLNNPSSNPFDTWVDKLVEQSLIYPWLLDPEIMSITAAAWLEGRSATLAELASTNWWRTHSEQQRNWLSFSNSDPTGAMQRMKDNRILVADQLRAAGINNAPGALVDLIADNFTMGDWTQTFANNQIAILSDPSRTGELDASIVALQLQGLDTNQARTDSVRREVRKWLGPMHGNWTEDQINDWASFVRNDPDGQARLTELLSSQRMALFPEYEDKSLTYEDIASPWRAMVFNEWGQRPDEMDPFFSNIIRMNDAFSAQKALRTEGLNRNNGKVGLAATADLLSSFGGNVIRTQ